MNSLADEAEVALRSHGYSTLRVKGLEAVAFEDDTLLGFVLEYQKVATLLERWEGDQMKLLTRFAPALRAVREKAWNVYVVMLVAPSPESSQERFALEMLEADLTSTRKLPRSGINTPSDLSTALNPVLPITSKANLSEESFTERLRQRLQADVGSQITELFLSKANENVVAQALIETT